jgi:hypothetical protein
MFVVQDSATLEILENCQGKFPTDNYGEANRIANGKCLARCTVGSVRGQHGHARLLFCVVLVLALCSVRSL